MIIYKNTKQGFLNDVFSNNFDVIIYKFFQNKLNRSVGISERRSWKDTGEYMYKILVDSSIPNNVGVAIEYLIPGTSKRVDFMITGKNENNNSIVLIELKQWSSSELSDSDGVIKVKFQKDRLVETPHPCYQVWSYTTLLENLNSNIDSQSIKLEPCAYLHNYDSDNIIDNVFYNNYIQKAPLFLKSDALKLQNFIKQYIKQGDDCKSILYIENGKIKPSKNLQDSLYNMINGNKEFVMIDDQKIVYEKALKMATDSSIDNKKRVLIVNGGPGSGKSVVAINLLVDLIVNKKLLASYVTKNSAPKEVFFSKLKNNIKESLISKASNIDDVKYFFKGSGDFISAESNIFDALIVDEAHRLTEKSGLFKNKGENQVKEIIKASKFSVFFIDENQQVTLQDIGSNSVIRNYAKQFDAITEEVELKSQFRCNGSDSYLLWLDDVLEIRETANFNYKYDYDFQVIDDPNLLKDIIFKKNLENNKSRLVAGYCWDWISNTRNNSDCYDIVIPEYNFSMSWNLANTKTWAIDKNSINEIGCIHACQGLEFDYVGVIIGLDMRYENGRIITDFTKRASTDRSLSGIKKIYKSDQNKANKIADKIIKNTYRTLMTRGMRGCYIFCLDKNLQEYFKKRINDANI